MLDTSIGECRSNPSLSSSIVGGSEESGLAKLVAQREEERKHRMELLQKAWLLSMDGGGDDEGDMPDITPR